MKTIAKIVLMVLFLGAANTLLAQGQINIKTERPMTKMLLFKWNDGVTEEQKKEVAVLFEDLVQEVNGFDSFEITKLTYSYRFETAFILKFSSEEAEKHYQEHQKHQKLASLGPILINDFQEIKY